MIENFIILFDDVAEGNLGKLQLQRKISCYPPQINKLVVKIIVILLLYLFFASSWLVTFSQKSPKL